MLKSCWHTKWKFALSYGVAFDASSHLQVSRGETLKIVWVLWGHSLRMFADKWESNIGLWWEFVSSGTHARAYCFVYIFVRLPSGGHTDTHTRLTRQLNFIFKISFNFVFIIGVARDLFLCRLRCATAFSLVASNYEKEFSVPYSCFMRAWPVKSVSSCSHFDLEKMQHMWVWMDVRTLRLQHAASEFVCPIEILSRRSHSHHCNHLNAQNLKLHARELFAIFLLHSPYFLALTSPFNFNWPRTDFTHTHSQLTRSQLTRI